MENDWCFSDEHFVLTNRGLIKAKDLRVDDKIISDERDLVEIKNIIRYEKKKTFFIHYCPN